MNYPATIFGHLQDDMDRALNGENHGIRPSARAIRYVFSLPATRGGKPAKAEMGPLTAELLRGKK